MKLFDIVNSYTYVVKRQRIICTHVQKLPRAIGLASRESAKNRYQNIIDPCVCRPFTIYAGAPIEEISFPVKSKIMHTYPRIQEPWWQASRNPNCLVNEPHLQSSPRLLKYKT